MQITSITAGLPALWAHRARDQLVPPLIIEMTDRLEEALPVPADELLERNGDALAERDFDERLTGVFEATFPDLAPEAIPTAGVATVEEWDSLQAVVLMTILEEEFGISIPPVDLPGLDSYASVRDYVLRALRA